MFLDSLHQGYRIKMEDSNWKQRAALALQEGLLHQQEESAMIDVSIKVEDESFQCHKSVLAGVSPYFQAMFAGNFKEHDQKEVYHLRHLAILLLSYMAKRTG